MEDKDFLELQIESLVLYNYIKAYDKFEKFILTEFKQSFDSLSNDIKQRIYFYLGCVGNLETYIEYDTYSTVSRTNKFSEQKSLSKLTFNQVVKLDKKEKIISKFNIEVQSLARKKVVFPFHDCCLKLLQMRNTLAHEFIKFVSQDNNTIELLPSQIIVDHFEPWLNDFTIESMSDLSKAIYSNYIMMKEIYAKITGV